MSFSCLFWRSPVSIVSFWLLCLKSKSCFTLLVWVVLPIKRFVNCFCAVKSLTETMNVTITFEPTKDKGTKFAIAVPTKTITKSNHTNTPNKTPKNKTKQKAISIHNNKPTTQPAKKQHTQHKIKPRIHKHNVY